MKCKIYWSAFLGIFFVELVRWIAWKNNKGAFPIGKDMAWWVYVIISVFQIFVGPFVVKVWEGKDGRPKSALTTGMAFNFWISVWIR